MARVGDNRGLLSGGSGFLAISDILLTPSFHLGAATVVILSIDWRDVLYLAYLQEVFDPSHTRNVKLQAKRMRSLKSKVQVLAVRLVVFSCKTEYTCCPTFLSCVLWSYNVQRAAGATASPSDMHRHDLNILSFRDFLAQGKQLSRDERRALRQDVHVARPPSPPCDEPHIIL